MITSLAVDKLAAVKSQASSIPALPQEAAPRKVGTSSDGSMRPADSARPTFFCWQLLRCYRPLQWTWSFRYSSHLPEAFKAGRKTLGWSSACFLPGPLSLRRLAVRCRTGWVAEIFLWRDAWSMPWLLLDGAVSEGILALSMFRLFVGAGAGTCLAIAFAVVRDTTAGTRTSTTVAKITGAMWAFSIAGAPLATLLLSPLGMAINILEHLVGQRHADGPARPVFAGNAAGIEACRFLGQGRGHRLRARRRFQVLSGERNGRRNGVFPAVHDWCQRRFAFERDEWPAWHLHYAVVVSGLSGGSLLSVVTLKQGISRFMTQAMGVSFMSLGGAALCAYIVLCPDSSRSASLMTLFLSLSTLGVGIATPCSISGAVYSISGARWHRIIAPWESFAWPRPLR